ncbi:MAG: hypothetical protein ABI443_07490 [Chthoniobacterales bacterium]
MNRPRHFLLSCLIAILAISGLNAAKPVNASTEDGASAEADVQNLPSAHVQREVMDFSDAYASAIRHFVDEYVRSEPDAAKRTDAQAWKVLFTSAAMTIAASPDAHTNLLDMVVFISVGKWGVNEYWASKIFGKDATKLRGIYAEMDREIWRQAAKVMTASQQQSLRRLISVWESSNPKSYEVSDVRLRNLEGLRPGEFDKDGSAKGILAGLRKALGRVDSSLLYGERVMFYMEHTPRILTQQTDLTLAQIAQAFPIATVNPDWSRLSALVEKLPTQIQEGIDKNQGIARELLPELHATVVSGEHLTANLNTTLQSLSTLTRNANGAPMTADQYAEMLKDTNGALQHLDSIVTNLNVLLQDEPVNSSKTEKLVRILDDRADHILHSVYRFVFTLLAAILAAVIIILLIAKFLFFSRKTS